MNSPDELIYKLAVPKAYLLFGGMIDLPLNSYSYASTALSHVSLAALALSGGIAAKLVHAALFVAALVVLRRLGDRLAPGSGVWVAAVMAWTPALMLIAGWAWSEWGVLALLLLSYLGWLELQERPSASAAALVTCGSRRSGGDQVHRSALDRWCSRCSLRCGSRVGGLGGDASPERGRRLGAVARGGRRCRWRSLGAFFYLRNWLWSGSPVARSCCRARRRSSTTARRARSSGWQELLLGYDIVHTGIVDDALGVLLPVCALLAPFGALRYRAARDLFWIGLVPLPFLIAVAPTSRLMLGSAAPLAVVGALYLAASWRAIASALARRDRRRWRGARARDAARTGSLRRGHLLRSARGPASAAETEAAYFARMRAYASAYQWVAENTPPESRVF